MLSNRFSFTSLVSLLSRFVFVYLNCHLSHDHCKHNLISDNTCFKVTTYHLFWSVIRCPYSAWFIIPFVSLLLLAVTQWLGNLVICLLISSLFLGFIKLTRELFFELGEFTYLFYRYFMPSIYKNYCELSIGLHSYLTLCILIHRVTQKPTQYPIYMHACTSVHRLRAKSHTRGVVAHW